MKNEDDIKDNNNDNAIKDNINDKAVEQKQDNEVIVQEFNHNQYNNDNLSNNFIEGICNNENENDKSQVNNDSNYVENTETYIIECFDRLIKEDFNFIKDLFLNSPPPLNPWNFYNKNSFSLLQMASFHDNFNMVMVIIESIKERKLKVEEILSFINYQSDKGFTALHYASYRGNIAMIKYLIQNGSDINLKTNTKSDVMHLAAYGGKANSLLFFKEFYKMDCNVRDESASTPLHWACINGNELVINFLITFENIDINCQDETDGNTPLHLLVSF
jgi:ankyrin repeat protein